MPDASNNTNAPYSGSISFSPLVAGGGSPFNLAGGLHFDLPLATLQSIQNNALAFTAGTNTNNQGFLSSVLNRNAALVAHANDQAAASGAATLAAAKSVAFGNINLATLIANNALEASKYAVQQQSYQVQTQQKQSTLRKLFGGLTGGIFG